MVGATIISKYDYAVNAVNQRDGVATSGSALAGASSVAWWDGAVGQMDGENQLISTTVKSGTPTLYTYDAYHRRVAKRTSATDVAYTVYDAWGMSNAKARNCLGWACERLEDSGLPLPQKKGTGRRIKPNERHLWPSGASRDTGASPTVPWFALSIHD